MARKNKLNIKRVLPIEEKKGSKEEKINEINKKFYP